MTRHLIPCDRCRPGRLLPGEALVSRRAYDGQALCHSCREVRGWLDEAPDAESELRASGVWSYRYPRAMEVA